MDDEEPLTLRGLVWGTASSNDPSEIMNPTNLMNLFTKINTTVQDKIKTGDLDLAKVTNELPDLYSNMQQDPLFNQMVNMQSENNT